MTPEEIRGLELLFESMDVDHSGTITLDELQYALKQQGSWLIESEVQALLDAVGRTRYVLRSSCVGNSRVTVQPSPSHPGAKEKGKDCG